MCIVGGNLDWELEMEGRERENCVILCLRSERSEGIFIEKGSVLERV